MFELETIMTTDVVSVSPSDPVAKARLLMKDHRIRHLPVVSDSGELIGLVTQTDLFAAQDSFLREKDDRLPVRDFPVEDIMVTGIATVEKKASLRQAALFLEKHRFGCLPVVENGKLVGIVTDSDFVGVAINLLEQIEENEAELSYLEE
ncbi:MAG: CBS domain-containing protein [Gammaproteobacteria bacterium]|nr:CBS domain-containing protein [Gammaproteobacteria bacterium]